MYYKYHGDKVSNLAAIDIGTNSCRLLISRVFINFQKRSHLKFHIPPVTWKPIDSYCKIVKLGEGLAKTGLLDDLAMKKTLNALYGCYKKICYYKVNHLRIVATEACRKAENANNLIYKAKQLYNLSVEVISAKEEIEFALLGCAEMINWKKKYLIVFDIGGGSTEIIWAKLYNQHKYNYLFHNFYEILDTVSLPYGVVSVNDNLSGYISPKEIFNNIHKIIKDDLDKFAKKNSIKDNIKLDDIQIIGSSGTVTTFGAIHLGLETYDRKKIDGLNVSINEMSNLCKNLNTYQDKLKNNDFIKRFDMMNVGAGILLGIFESFNLDELTIADRGVREGVIVDLIRNKILPHFQILNKKPAHNHQ